MFDRPKNSHPSPQHRSLNQPSSEGSWIQIIPVMPPSCVAAVLAYTRYEDAVGCAGVIPLNNMWRPISYRNCPPSRWPPPSYVLTDAFQLYSLTMCDCISVSVPVAHNSLPSSSSLSLGGPSFPNKEEILRGTITRLSPSLMLLLLLLNLNIATVTRQQQRRGGGWGMMEERDQKYCRSCRERNAVGRRKHSISERISVVV